MKKINYVAIIALLAFTTAISAKETQRRHHKSSHKHSIRQDNSIQYYKVWDSAPHNAFTDITFFKGNFYIVCREGSAHVSNDGAIRVLKSSDGKRFSPVTIFKDPDYDLRDPKILNLGDTTLYIQYCMANRGKKITKNGMNWSGNGSDWSTTKVYDENDVWWLWGAKSVDGKILSIGYNYINNDNNYLFISNQLGEYKASKRIVGSGASGEASLESNRDTVFCAIRAKHWSLPGYLGFALKSDLTNWKTFEQNKDLILGGPKLFFLPNGKLYLLTRSKTKEGSLATVLFLVNRSDFSLSQVLVLPNAGDNSGDNGYAGVVHHDGNLYISYYLTVNKKAQVFIAKIPLSQFQ